MNKTDNIQSIGICRTCATESRGLKNLFTLSDYNITFAEMIFVCTQITIYETTERPTNICRNCISKLKIAYEFHNLVRSCEEKFLLQNVTKTEEEFDEIYVEPPHIITIEPAELLSVEEPEMVGDEPTIFVKSEPEQLVEFDEAISEDQTQLPRRGRKRGRPRSEKHQEIRRGRKPSFEIKGKKSFECYQCRKQFKSLFKVKLHLRDHDPTYRCRICMKHFTKQHYKEHLCKGASIECEQCSRTFTSTMNLVYHLKAHKIQNTHKCYKCARKYPMKLLLEFHKESHTNEEKKFICDICDTRVRSKYLIKEHMESVHTDKRSNLDNYLF